MLKQIVELRQNIWILLHLSLYSLLVLYTISVCVLDIPLTQQTSSE